MRKRNFVKEGKVCVSRGQNRHILPGIKHRCVCLLPGAAFKLIKYLWNCRAGQNLVKYPRSLYFDGLFVCFLAMPARKIPDFMNRNRFVCWMNIYWIFRTAFWQQLSFLERYTFQTLAPPGIHLINGKPVENSPESCAENSTSLRWKGLKRTGVFFVLCAWNERECRRNRNLLNRFAGIVFLHCA